MAGKSDTQKKVTTLKKLIEQDKLTVAEMCNKANLSVATFYKWKKEGVFGGVQSDSLSSAYVYSPHGDYKPDQFVHVRDKNVIFNIMDKKGFKINKDNVECLVFDKFGSIVHVQFIGNNRLSDQEIKKLNDDSSWKNNPNLRTDVMKDMRVASKALADVTDEKKDAIGVPVPGIARDPKTGHFSAGNVGKQKGSRDWRAKFIEAITPEKANVLVNKYVQLIETGRDNVEGDVEAILFGMKRLFPENANQRYVNIDLKRGKIDLNILSGVNDAVGIVIDEVTSSGISVDDGREIVDLLERKQNFNLGKLQEEADKFTELQKEGK